MLKAHAAELRAWASDADVRLPSAESAGEAAGTGSTCPKSLRYRSSRAMATSPGFQQPQQWQQQPWN